MTGETDYWPRPPRTRAAVWAANDTVLREAEFGVVKDEDQFKIGDGETSWNDLPAYESTDRIIAAIELPFEHFATVDRPDPSERRTYYDTTLDKPAWASADRTEWRDATGTVI